MKFQILPEASPCKLNIKNFINRGSGKLGKANSLNIFPDFPLLDITKPAQIRKFLSHHDIDAIIHCAAVARMSIW